MNYSLRAKSVVLTFFLLSLALPSAHAQPKVVAPADGFPPLPTFDLHDHYNARELENVKAEVKFNQLNIRTSIPLNPKKLSSFPRLGSAAFEVLSRESLWGTFAMASVQDAGPGSDLKGVANLSFTRFQKSLKPEQMFYRRFDVLGIFNSPLFSPDGRTVVFHDGITDSPSGGFNIFLWQLARGRWRYVPLSIHSSPLLWSPGSRFLSFIVGGEGERVASPMALRSLDVETRQQKLIMDAPGRDWSWTYDGHLLCGRFPRNANWTALQPHPRPSVYRVSARGGRALKLFDGGYYAHESPDGQNIVFCDWPDQLIEPQNAPDEVRNNAQQGLFVWNAHSKKRVFLAPLPINIADLPYNSSPEPQMVWSSDNRRIFVLVPGPNSVALSAQVEAQVYVVDVAAKTCQQLGKFAFVPALAQAGSSVFDFRPMKNASMSNQANRCKGRKATVMCVIRSGR